MKRTSKDKAIDCLIGSDGFVCITGRLLSDGDVEINVTSHFLSEDMVHSLANELLYVVRSMIYGQEPETRVREESSGTSDEDS